MAASVTLAMISAFAAFKIYTNGKGTSEKIKQSLGRAYDLVNNKYYVDEIYFGGIIDPIVKQSQNLWMYIDVNFIDKITYKVSDMTRAAGSLVRSFQTGNMQQYAMYITIGVVVVLTFVLMR
jgi:NADH-quinone oxidoreductase subunit L